MTAPRARFALLVALLACASCAGISGTVPSKEVPVVRLPAFEAGVVDGRARFRQIFCDIDAQVGRDFPDFRECADALVAVGEEPQGPPPAQTPAAGPLPVLVFITGLFGECVRDLAEPFSDSYAALAAAGYRILVVPVEGRSSSERNAQIISDTLRDRVQAGDRLVVIGFSKGVPDFLEALGRHAGEPWVGRVEALVSVAGVVNGTPVADGLRGAYDTLLARLPLPGCPAGDGKALDSLTRPERQRWLAANPPPKSIRYYSLVAVAMQGHLNPLLGPFHEELSSDGPLDDGQVLAEDAVLPGSHLLGFASADHWAVALPFGRSASLEALPFKAANDYPREVLIRAILAYVAATAPARDSSGPQGVPRAERD
jgi:hypothetical protein